LDRASNVRTALGRAIESAKAEGCNCIQIESVDARSLVGLPYVTVSAHPRHIQKGKTFFGPKTQRHEEGAERGSEMPEFRTTAEKALQINLDVGRFGTFAEIGAGQEVVRWFFQVGRASGTIAKSNSAYDMAVSDELYGSADRYVSRGRLEAMLGYEFS